MKYRKSKLFITLLLIMFCVQLGHSQNEIAVTTTENIPNTKTYFQLGIGTGFFQYRDFATSLLFYSGAFGNLRMAWAKRSEKRDRTFEIGLGSGSLAAQIPESNYLQASSSSTLGQINLAYSQFWKLDRLSNEKNDVKLGGQLQITQNLRVNSDLFNNASGFENISNLMISGQVTRDISRKEERTLNLWLFKPTLKKVKRALRFQLNAGLLNFNYRPGYAYSYDAELVGLETNPLLYILSDYRMSLNGWRFRTELECITYLPSGNAKSWSYVWDAANVPGQYETFQMGSHELRFTYYFQTKKR